MPRRGERSKGLGYKKPVKKAKVDLVSSPLTEPLQDEDVIVVTPDDLLLGNNKSYKERRALIASYTGNETPSIREVIVLLVVY